MLLTVPITSPYSVLTIQRRALNLSWGAGRPIAASARPAGRSAKSFWLVMRCFEGWGAGLGCSGAGVGCS
jgi:hypothetical protein